MQKDRLDALNQLPSQWKKKVRAKAVVWISVIALASLMTVVVFGLSQKDSTIVEEAQVEEELSTRNYVEKIPRPTLPIIKVRIKKNDTLETILTKKGANYEEALALAKALKGLVNPKRLQRGREIQFGFYKDGGLASFKYTQSPVEIYEVTWSEAGFVAREIVIPIETKTQKIAIRLDTSLYQSLIDVGERSELISLLVDILAWDVDFFSDPRKGDEVKLLVEKKYIQEEFYEYGRILSVSYQGARVKKTAFYFEPQDGYFDAKGNSLARNFLKSPVKYSRISSRFGRRRHPVTHRLQKHQGTDYAAPTGTPVWAVADGRVMEKAYNRFNGRYVKIKHGNGYETFYLHLSRFQKGLRVGQRVSQKQLIGYVGATGRASGPHLHLSVKYNGRYIDPLKIKKVKRTSLTGESLIAFKEVLPVKMEELFWRVPLARIELAANQL